MEADSKTTWDQLSKGFSNVLRRKNKKSGSGASDEREWKFEKELMFLLPFKQSRATWSNLDARMEQYSERCSGIEGSVTSPDVERAPKPKRQKKSSSNDEDVILGMLRQRQEEKSKESQRLGFFKSLMTSVDKLTESQFMGLQMDFIRSLHIRSESQVTTSTPMPQREERRDEQQQQANFFNEHQRFEEEYPYAGSSSLFEL